MPFDEHKRDGSGGDDPVRRLAQKTVDDFDDATGEANICAACATRLLIEEAILSLFIIGILSGVEMDRISSVIDGHKKRAADLVGALKARGLV